MANKEWLKTGVDGISFGERLDDLIRSAKIDQSQLSRETGISQSAISEYVSGKKGGTEFRAPDCATVIALAKYFSVSTDFLLGQTEYRTQDTEMVEVCKYTGLSEASLKNILLETKGTESRKVLNVILGFDSDAFHGIIQSAGRGIAIAKKYQHKMFNWNLIPEEIRQELYSLLGVEFGEFDPSFYARDRYFERAKNYLDHILLCYLLSQDGTEEFDFDYTEKVEMPCLEEEDGVPNGID